MLGRPSRPGRSPTPTRPNGAHAGRAAGIVRQQQEDVIDAKAMHPEAAAADIHLISHGDAKGGATNSPATAPAPAPATPLPSPPSPLSPSVPTVSFPPTPALPLPPPGYIAYEQVAEEETSRGSLCAWFGLAWDLCEKYAFDFKTSLGNPVLAVEVVMLFTWGMFLYSGMVAFLEHDTRLELAEHVYDALKMCGTLLFFLITFRTQQAYERWWEGRVVWGNWARFSNDVAMQACLWLPDQQLVDRICRLTVAYAYLSKLSLRDEVNDIDQLEWEIGDLLKGTRRDPRSTLSCPCMPPRMTTAALAVARACSPRQRPFVLLARSCGTLPPTAGRATRIPQPTRFTSSTTLRCASPRTASRRCAHA